MAVSLADVQTGSSNASERRRFARFDPIPPYQEAYGIVRNETG